MSDARLAELREAGEAVCAALERAQDALKFYARPSSWSEVQDVNGEYTRTTPIPADRGERAGEVLDGSLGAAMFNFRALAK